MIPVERQQYDSTLRLSTWEIRANKKGRGRHQLITELQPVLGVETRSKRPQLPCWCREHRSERPRSEVRHHPQLCAKPPHRPLAAQRASASALPARCADRELLARLRGQCWPASLAGSGRSAHLASVRSTRTWRSSQAERSGRCPENTQRAAPLRSYFLRPLAGRASRGAPRPKTSQRRPCPPIRRYRRFAPWPFQHVQRRWRLHRSRGAAGRCLAAWLL